MKNLSDFKKRLQVGSKLHTIYHQKFIGRHENGSGEPVWGIEDRGVREISIRQSNAFAFKTQKTDGTFHDTWCHYPKASQCNFIDADTMQILEPDGRVREGEKPLIPILTYKFISNG